VKNIAFIGVVGVAALGLFFALSSSVGHQGVKVGIRSAAACSETKPAECLPDLGYIDTDGTAWTREGLANKVVMVNFWATWCAPCKAEIPALTATYQRHASEDFVLLGVMMDSDDVSEQALDSFVQRVGLDYPVVPIDSDIWSAFDAPSALPMTFIYDRIGKLRLRHRGALSESQLESVVKELLAEPVPDA
jgi:thiol-disulfide isomerase/thioredoxin